MKSMIIRYIKENELDELLNLYPNKFILVSGEETKNIEAFDSYDTAAQRGIEIFGIDRNFLVHFMSTIQANNFILHA